MALIQVNFFSKCLMRTVTLNAIIPVDKMSPEGEDVIERKPFKTLYLLHGIYGNYTDWITGTRIQAWAQKKNLAVIMPSGENHFYVDCKATGEKFGEFVGDELVKITRDLFPLSDKSEDTFIAGLSMGGYGALRNGLKYWKNFGYIAGLSSALILDDIRKPAEHMNDLLHNKNFFQVVFGDLEQIIGSDMDYKALILQLKKENAEIPKIYMACGTEDFLLEQNRDYHSFLIEQGIAVTYEEGPGGHEWDFWDRYINRVLEWLPLEEDSEGVHSGNVQ